jgi:hypothetical protein
MGKIFTQSLPPPQQNGLPFAIVVLNVDMNKDVVMIAYLNILEVNCMEALTKAIRSLRLSVEITSVSSVVRVVLSMDKPRKLLITHYSYEREPGNRFIVM